MALTLLSVVFLALFAVKTSAAPQGFINQGGTLLVPIDQLKQTEIKGVQYVVLSANPNQPQGIAPGRFFLRSPETPAAPAPIQRVETVFQAPPAQPSVRVSQPFVQQANPQQQAVLVRKEIINSGQKLAVFRKPVEAENEVETVEVNPRPYAFSYEINGGDTGDVKSASETSDGSAITGFYSLIEPDGTLRVVKYRADKKTGFTAQVERTAGAYPPIPDPIRKPEVTAA